MAKKENKKSTTAVSAKTGTKAVKSGKGNMFHRIVNYFKDLKNELKKVVWPNKKKIFHGTIIVLATVIVVVIIVVLADLLFQNLLKLLLGQLS